MNIRRALYQALIEPRHTDEDIRNREIVLNALLASMSFILVCALLVLAFRIITGDTFLATRAVSVFATALLVGSLLFLSRRGWHRTASSLLILIDFLLASVLVYEWGIGVPTAILLYGLVIVLAGILLGAVFVLYVAAAAVATITLLHIGATHGTINSDWSWLANPPGMTDVASYVLLFAALALVVWLFNHQMARSLRKAEQAEAELLKQKELLEIKVRERSRELQKAQLEKVKQMYRFAELGQLSTALMHELANHLTSLTLDIEGLQGQGRSRAVSRAKRSINYINEMVVRVREQLHGKGHMRTFNVVDEIDAVVKMLRHKAQLASVSLDLQPPVSSKGFRINGEPIWLRQIIANLISNGIDAHYEPRDDITEKRAVEVQLASDEHHITITINDWGRGIPKEHCNKLFEPFFSTKETGMGMGLYIVKQIVSEHFLGDIKIANSARPTSFVVTLPKA